MNYGDGLDVAYRLDRIDMESCPEPLSDYGVILMELAGATPARVVAMRESQMMARWRWLMGVLYHLQMRAECDFGPPRDANQRNITFFATSNLEDGGVTLRLAWRPRCEIQRPEMLCRVPMGAIPATETYKVVYR